MLFKINLLHGAPQRKIQLLRHVLPAERLRTKQETVITRFIRHITPGRQLLILAIVVQRRVDIALMPGKVAAEAVRMDNNRVVDCVVDLLLCIVSFTIKSTEIHIILQAHVMRLQIVLRSQYLDFIVQ